MANFINYDCLGYVNSLQSIGTVDGPGLRYVIFLQGCSLRCVYCHNPETWAFSGGKPYTVAELIKMLKRYKTYFGDKGGVTISGGEPLQQSEFVLELLKACKAEGINTAVDSSGIWQKQAKYTVEAVLQVADLLILDVKFAQAAAYQKQTLGSLEQVLATLAMREATGKETWIRQVIVPDLNDSEAQVLQLKELLQPYKCISQIQLLPFRKLCLEKYENLNLEFPLAATAEADPEFVASLNQLLK